MEWETLSGHAPREMSRGRIGVDINIDDAIDLLKKGRFQRRLLAAAGICNGVNAMAVMALSFIRNPITVEFGLSDEQSNWFQSSVFFGMLFGTLLFGPLGDEYGRKPTFLLSSIITAVCSFASSFAPSFPVLTLLRFGVGIGVGGTVIPYDTLAELTPSRFRGAFLLYMGYFWTVGTSATPAIAYYALMEKKSWRLFLLLCSIPSFFSMFVGYLWVPESPRWLVTKGRHEEALAILREGARTNRQNMQKLYPVGTAIVNPEEEEGEEEMDSLKSLFRPQWRRMVICMLLVWAFLDFMYWGTIQIVTLVFAEFEGNLKLFEEGEQFEYDYGAVIGSSLAEVVGQTAVLLLIDRWGRVPTQALAYACGALAVFCLCLVAYYEDTGSETQRYVLVLLAFVARMFMMAATSCTWVHTAEMLPTQIRNTAHAVADALAGSGGACTAFLVTPNNSMLMIGTVMGSITIFTATLVWGLPETKGIALGTAISKSRSPSRSPEPSRAASIDGGSQRSVRSIQFADVVSKTEIETGIDGSDIQPDTLAAKPEAVPHDGGQVEAMGGSLRSSTKETETAIVDSDLPHDTVLDIPEGILKEEGQSQESQALAGGTTEPPQAIAVEKPPKAVATEEKPTIAVDDPTKAAEDERITEIANRSESV